MTRFERVVLWVSALATTASGAAYAWMKYLVVSDDPFAIANHPWQPWMLKAHILSAPLLVFGIGMVTASHVWRHWRAGRPAGRRTGSLALAVGGTMILSGYLIQAVTHAGWLAWIVGVHLAAGFLYFVSFLAHNVARRAEARRRATPRVYNSSRSPAASD